MECIKSHNNSIIAVSKDPLSKSIGITLLNRCVYGDMGVANLRPYAVSYSSDIRVLRLISL